MILIIKIIVIITTTTTTTIIIIIIITAFDWKENALHFGFPVQNIGLQNGSTQDLPSWRHLEYVTRLVSLQPRTQGPRAGSKWWRYEGPGYEVGVTAFARDITIDRMFSDGFSTCCVFPGLDWFRPVLVRLFLTQLFWTRMNYILPSQRLTCW